MSDPVEVLAAWYGSLTPASLGEIDRYYASDARFRDPFNDVRGTAAIAGIFRHMFEATTDPRFTVLERATSRRSEWLYWEFEFGVGGRRLRIPGASRLTFDAAGKVTEHLDFWDPVAGIWSHLPVIGGAVRWLARRFSAAPATSHPPRAGGG